MANPESSKSAPLRSAEVIVAGVLLAVCVVVGAAYWLLSPKTRPATAPAVSHTPASAPAKTPEQTAAEQDALAAWNHKLKDNFAELDEQRQQKAEQEALERKKAEAAAEAAQQAAAVEAARKAAEAAKARTQASAARARSNTSAPAAAGDSAPRKTRAVKRVEASIDWNSCRQPDYPNRSKDRGEQGIVTLLFSLDASGDVLDGTIKQSSGSDRLDDAALRAIRKCHFKPATVDGEAVASRATIRFQWKLDGL
ncbi:MAG TPA: energy transducer TonB [Solimonas sp.]|nr:energy transducer TonB [Solimonas sp.]